MALIGFGQPFFEKQVKRAVVALPGVPGPGVEHRLGPRIGGEEGEPAREASFKPGEQAMVGSGDVGGDQLNVAPLRERLHAFAFEHVDRVESPRPVKVARLRADVARLEDHGAAQGALDVERPLLHVAHAVVVGNGEHLAGRRGRDVLRNARGGHANADGAGIVQLIDAGAERDVLRALGEIVQHVDVVENAVGRADDGLVVGKRAVGQSEPGREVVEVAFVERRRDSGGGKQILRAEVEIARAAANVAQHRVVLIAQAHVEGEAAGDLEIVGDKSVGAPAEQARELSGFEPRHFAVGRAYLEGLIEQEVCPGHRFAGGGGEALAGVNAGEAELSGDELVGLSSQQQVKEVATDLD